MVKDIAIGAGGHGFESRAGETEHSVAIAATFLQSCAVQALSHGDEPRNSSHASAYHREYR